MRAVAWLLLVLLVGAAGLLALLRWQPQSVPSWVLGYVPTELAKAVAQSPAPGANPAATATPAKSDPNDPNGPAIYAWKDDQGRWNYTDEPPAGRAYETRQYRQDVNVVPAYQSDEDDG